MKYTCPTCGKQNDTNYCNTCNKPVSPPNDNSGKNAMLVWGIIMMFLGAIGGVFTLSLVNSENAMWIYSLIITICLFGLGLILLGISAVVDRLNTIIKLLKENRSDKA